MNRIRLVSLLLLATAGGIWFQSGPARPDRESIPPLSLEHLTIASSDPGDVAALKFAALEQAGQAREALKFADRLRKNPQTQEFAGAAPAAAAWREIAQDVRHTSQQGLALKIEQLQDSPNGWQEAAEYLAAAGAGWQESAEELSRLVKAKGK